MEVTIKQRTWTPYTYISEETMIREGNEISNMLDDINVDFNTLEFAIDGIAEGYSVYTEATEGVITKLGRKIAGLFRKIINWLNNIKGTSNMEDMNNIEKLETITKKYPLIKDRVMVLANEGLLDVSAIKDMNDFVDQYAKLDKWANPKELSNLDKHILKFKKFINGFDEYASAGSKVLKTSSEFMENGTRFKDSADKLVNTLTKAKPEDVEAGLNHMDEMLHRDNAAGYADNAKPGKDTSTTTTGTTGSTTTTEATNSNYNRNNKQYKNNGGKNNGPLREVGLTDVEIVKMLKAIYNMLAKCFTIISKWVASAINKVKKSRHRVASVEVGIGRLLDKYGSFENIVAANKQGKLKLPDYVTIKGDKFIVDVSNIE